MKRLFVLALALSLSVASFAAVQIVVLDTRDAGSNKVTYRYLCWLTAVNPLPNPNFVSAWTASSGVSAGPNAAQITALQNGTVIEQPGPAITVSSSTAVSAVENTMISNCNTAQQYLSNIPGPAIYYGQTWNGSSWILQ